MQQYEPKIQSDGQSSKIFDIIRRKYVVLTPEEWVRQHTIHYLINEKKVPGSLISVEKLLIVNQLSRRTDILVYNNALQPVLLAECKSENVNINQEVFDQAARYNLSLNVKYFMLTNGRQTFCCTMDHQHQRYNFLADIPLYLDMVRQAHHDILPDVTLSLSKGENNDNK